HMRDGARGGARERHLSLRALTGVEQETVRVPPQQVAVVVADARGYLASGPQGDQLTVRHTLTVRVAIRPHIRAPGSGSPRPGTVPTAGSPVRGRGGGFKARRPSSIALCCADVAER